MADKRRWFHFPHFRRLPLSGWLTLLFILICLAGGMIYAAAPQKDQTDYISMRQSAEAGNAESQYQMAEFYKRFARNPDEQKLVFFWYEKAARQSYIPAQIALAQCHYEGACASHDLSRAALWFERAAQQGDAFAQAWTGRIYEKGHGVSPDYVQAASWFRKAAEQNYSWAQSNPARLYEDGKGVPKDDRQAREWYEKAVLQGDSYAALRLAFLYYHGYGGPADFMKAGDYLGKAVKGGEEYAITYREKNAAQCKNASLPPLNDPFPRHIIYACIIAGAAGDAESQYRTALILERDNPYSPVARDPEQAHLFMQKAADQGIVQARARLRTDRP